MATRSGRTRDELPEHRRRIYNREVCRDYDALIERALALPGGKCLVVTGWPDGSPIDGERGRRGAWDLLNKIKDCKLGRQYTIRRNQADGLGPRQRPDGTWEIRFTVRPKARAGTT